jgi:isocitrate dehydrogenase kinase/phosphatase
VPSSLEVEYVNLVRIAHSPSELVFDFAHLLPGSSPAQVRSRIVMSPLGAKLFYRALAENLAKYEAAFGEISVPGTTSLADFLFRPPQSPQQPPESPPQEE